MATHILLIEDEAQIRENVSELLTLHGFQVTTASNGREGISMALLEHPQLILCDIMMPEIDGYQVLEVIRSNHLLANVPFIFLTARTDPTDLRQGMIKGADDYLTKPFSIQHLVTTIESRLEREALRKAEIQAQLAKQRHALASVAGHEYNTNLNGILGFSTLLIDQFEDLTKEETLSMVELIKVCGLRLKRSLDNIRLIDALQHLDPGHPAYDCFVTGTTPITAKSVDEYLQSVLYRQDQKGTYTLQIESALVGMAEDNLRICIDELADNAFKFSDLTDDIRITGEIRGADYCLTITNKGRPFTPENIALIAPFKQFDRKKYEQQGFGVGLSIAKKLVEFNRGRLDITSPSPGETQVTIWLPLVAH